MQTILIIDDDTAIGDLEQEVLERAGYAVQRAYSGTEALLLLKSSRPDLILLDLMLPGLSGEEVLPRIQGIPVIVISAKTAVQDKVDLLLGGAAVSPRGGTAAGGGPLPAGGSLHLRQPDAGHGIP